MSPSKWYNKATVQAQIVNLLGVCLTASVGFLSIYYIRETALESQNFSKSKFQFDSLNANLQNQMLQNELHFQKKSFYLDSLVSTQNLKIARKKLEFLQEDRNIKKSEDLWQVKLAVWSVLELIEEKSLNQGYKELDKLSIKEKLELNSEIFTLLNNQMKNPALLQNKYCSERWKSAINRSKTINTVEIYPILPFSEQIGSLMTDVSQVWTVLILGYDENELNRK